jgi:hypothetical protein
MNERDELLKKAWDTRAMIERVTRLARGLMTADRDRLMDFAAELATAAGQLDLQIAQLSPVMPAA